MDNAKTIAAGMLLLLSGLFIMRLGLKNLFSHYFCAVLQNLTKTPLRGLLVGTVAAAVMQSSTVVTIFAIGLVSTGHLSFRHALSLILGANIGTCSTVQLFTLSLPNNSMFMLLSASLLAAALKKYRFAALALAGMCSVLSGLNFLSDGLKGITELNTVIACLNLAKQHPFYGVTAGVFLTFAIQSSSAATGLLMMLSQEGLIDLTTAIYGVYGNNIGSCLSSLLVGAAAPLSGKRLAVAHLTVNLLGVIAFYPFSQYFALAISAVCDDFAGQVAAAHTIFNIISSLAILPLIRPFSKLIAILVPDKRLHL